MAETVWVYGGRVVLPGSVIEADVQIDGGIITAIHSRAGGQAADRGKPGSATQIDASGCYVLPGLVDIHCDAIEKEVQPRPNTLFPLEMAFVEFERKLPVHGITSMYHSLSLGVGLSLRGDAILARLVEVIQQFRSRQAMVRHGIHLRYEVAHLAGLPIVERYIKEQMVDYLSFMDHSPGQGQYKEPGSFERYVMKNQGVDVQEVREIVADLQARQQAVDWGKLQQLGRLAAEKGIAVASHDDDSPAKVEEALRSGASVSEFPMNLDTANHAQALGLRVCVGAPNVIRGGSHDKNMKATDAIAAGKADILCSDYHPASLLAAVFKLAKDGITGLPEAVRMASLNPAEALGASSIGSIEPGKAGDLLLVTEYAGHPSVKATLVNGTEVYRSNFYFVG